MPNPFGSKTDGGNEEAVVLFLPFHISTASGKVLMGRKGK